MRPPVALLVYAPDGPRVATFYPMADFSPEWVALRWALEHGATHYTHWFQPQTGLTAEQHDSFLAPTGSGGGLAE